MSAIFFMSYKPEQHIYIKFWLDYAGNQPQQLFKLLNYLIIFNIFPFDKRIEDVKYKNTQNLIFNPLVKYNIFRY